MLDKQIQDIMFEVFTYAAITDGIMSSEGDRRTAQREEM